jgi:Helix-turn-helix domain
MMLEAEVQDALDHPVRREILRSLKDGDRPRTPVELAVRLAPFSIGQVNYHVQVLAGAGAVVGRDVSPSGGLPVVSGVCDKPQVIAVLQATERGDQERRQAALAAGLRVPTRGAGR